MASLTVNGLDELELTFADLARIPDGVKRQMLQQGGEKIREAQKQNAPKDTGKLADSITVGNYRLTSDGGHVDIYFRGTHHTTKKQGAQPNAKVANVLEYGTKDGSKPATQFIRKSNEQSADAAAEAELNVYSDWLASNNV